ncbi:MAG: AsmA-like C-terminal region-containing protein [Rickettsiales endosymbiont of Dermacentor nuttalli]
MINYKNTKNIIVTFTIIIFLVSVLCFVSIPIPKQIIANSFYKNTKLKLTINGNTYLSLTPNISIIIENAYISDDYNNVIAIFKELTLNTKLKSLFLDNLDIDNILIQKPVIFLDKLLSNKSSYINLSNIFDITTENIPIQTFQGNINQFIIENGTIYNTTGDDSSTLNSVSINAKFDNSLLIMLVSFNKLNINFNSSITTNLLTPSLIIKQDSKFNIVTLLSGGNLGTNISKISAQGQISFNNDNTYITTTVETNNLNLNLLANIYDISFFNTNQTTKNNNLSFAPRISINLLSLNTKINQLNIDKLNSKIEIANGNILSDFTASLLNTNISGKIIFYSNQNKPYVSSSFKIDNIDLAHFNTLDDTLSGTLQTEMSLSAFVYSMNAFKASLTGNGKISINNGHINGDKFSYITDLLSTVVGNNINVDPVNFKHITGTLNINNGFITNNDLIIDAEKCYLTGKGSYNLYYNTINYKLIPSKLLHTMYSGIETNLTIEGQLDKPVCKIDLKNYINYLNNRRP